MNFKDAFPIRILIFLLVLLVFSTPALANDVLVEPKISKHSTAEMFDEEKAYISHELIVKFKAGTTAEKRQQVLSAIEGKEVSSTLSDEISLVSVPKGTNLVAAADKLLKEKAIEFVQPNYEIEQTYVPSDADYKKQWYLPKIQMPKAWDTTKGSSAVTVAVIDSGVQVNHPDLKGKIVSPYNAVTGGTTFSDAWNSHYLLWLR